MERRSFFGGILASIFGISSTRDKEKVEPRKPALFELSEGEYYVVVGKTGIEKVEKVDDWEWSIDASTVTIDGLQTPYQEFFNKLPSSIDPV